MLAALLLLLTGEGGARAQGYYYAPGYPYGNPYYYGQPYPDRAVRRPAYREERRVRRPVYREERQARRRTYRAEREARAPRRFVRAAPAVEPRKVEPETPAVEPSTHIVVFGDSLANLISDGLEEAYDEAPEIEVVNKTKGDSGLVRNDVHDWPKVIQEYLNTNPPVTFAVVMVGVNDRQAIREGDAAHEPLSDRWRDIYRDRVDAVIRAFTERKLPLLWIGAPPTRNERFSADLAALNEIYRDRVKQAGGVYVDIGPGFVGDEGRYTPVGPDVDGQSARLRTGDGIHFTTAGARKAAHFIEVEIKRLLEARPSASVAATPAVPSEKPTTPEGAGQTNASAPPPEPAGLPTPPAKPVAGPVLPLTRAEVSPDGALLTGQPRPRGDTAAAVDRAYRAGVAPAPKPGRADDFKWPRS